MTRATSSRAHLIAGGFPPGASAGHDHDYARLELLELLAEQTLLRNAIAWGIGA